MVFFIKLISNFPFDLEGALAGSSLGCFIIDAVSYYPGGNRSSPLVAVILEDWNFQEALCEISL